MMHIRGSCGLIETSRQSFKSDSELFYWRHRDGLTVNAPGRHGLPMDPNESLRIHSGQFSACITALLLGWHGHGTILAKRGRGNSSQQLIISIFLESLARANSSLRSARPGIKFFERYFGTQLCAVGKRNCEQLERAS